MPPGRPGRSRSVLVVLALLSVTIVTLDVRGVEPFERLKDGAVSAVGSVQGALGGLTDPLERAWDGITGYGDLERENEELRERIGELERERVDDANAREQLERLEDELEIDYVGDLPQVKARVTSLSVGNFDDHRVRIDKGSSDGVDVGMPVVTSAGLVGVVERAGADHAVVQVITDPELVIGVRLVSSQDLAVGHGTGVGEPFLIDRAVELDTVVPDDEAVVTSGLEGSLLPPDIPVGTVRSATRDETARTQVLRVEPAAELDRLDVLTVLVWQPEEP